MNILVTGATGLLGSHVLSRLLKMDVRIRATAHQQPLAVPGVEVVTGDLQNKDFCQQVTSGMDWVFHCATTCRGVSMRASNPAAFTGNVVMHNRMLEAAYQAGVSKFLWPSSVLGYPFAEGTPFVEEEFNAGEPHDRCYACGWTARFVESLCRYYSEITPRKMLCVCPRLGCVVGAGGSRERRNVFQALALKVVNKEDPFVIWGTRTESRDFVYVEDVIEAIFLMVEKLDRFLPMNIVTGRQQTISDLAVTLFDVSNFHPQVTYQAMSPTSVPSTNVSAELAEKVLGWQAKTSFQDAVRLAMRHYIIT